MENPSNRRSLAEDEDRLTVLSLASFDYSSGGDNRHVRSRPTSPPAEEQQQQPDQHHSHQLPRRIPLQPPQPQSPFRLPLHYPVPVLAAASASSSRSPSPGRSRLNSSPESSKGGKKKKGKNKMITPPFPWATEYRAKVHRIKYLLQNEILTISGAVQCKRCERRYEMGFNLKEKFGEVCMFVKKHKREMNRRAAQEWNNPVFPICVHCGQENSVRPIIEDGKKRFINWLFLWLGQWLGQCTIDQLKYFCKQAGIHRTAAKTHLLYTVYTGIGNQLAPEKFESL